MYRELYKAQSDLSLSGRGVILFGVWNFIKVFLYTWFAPNYFESFFDPDEYDAFYIRLFIIFIAVITFINMLIRFYIGHHAVREAKSPSGAGRVYLALACLMLAYCVFALYSAVTALFSDQSIFDSVSELLLQTGSLISLTGLLCAALRIKKLRKAMASEVTADAA